MSLALIFYVMDSTIISALIAGCTAILINIISNVVLTNRQTALLEYRLKQVEPLRVEIQKLTERVTVLETLVMGLGKGEK